MNNPKNTVTSLDDLPLFLTVEQTAAVLSIGRNTTYDMVRSGRIESIRLGRQIRIPKSALNSI
ncbi:MAG: helix-turn-helix domain-containing protein [Oscillospiraceae bacterium]|nr:helix-turn-helix domain-containing protein [Oscillospiraceae bacterium]